MTPAQAYEEMTDTELKEFVPAYLPKILERINYKPRCYICRDRIIQELARRPLFEALEGRSR
jgi:hypothetical protein